MSAFGNILKHILTAVWLAAGLSAGPSAGFGGSAAAGADTLDGLMQQLKSANDATWKPIEDKIWAAWSRSGSAAMDLLLKRGRDAIDAQDYDAAIEHLTALIDHAPDFAEGYDARALAYYQSGRYGPALQDIRHVLSLNPRHFGALAGLAAILEEAGKPKKALEVYRKVLAIHPHKPDVLKAVKRLEDSLGGVAL